MTQAQQDELERATLIAQRDQLCPITGMRCDTGEPIWLVQSRRDPHRIYVLFIKAGRIRCQCQQSLHGGICAHAAAVRLTLPPQPRADAPAGEQQPEDTPHPSSHSDPRAAEEAQQRAAALRRERALLWTDDRPFRIWKS